MIRRAEARDAPALARVHVMSWRAAYPGLLDQGFLDSLDLDAREEWWQRALGRKANLVSVAEVDGRVEGFCLAAESTTEGWGEIYSLYVTADHWGQSLGRGLLGVGERDLAGAGFEEALLWVLEGNTRARDFYERQGWSKGKPIRLEEIGGRPVTEVRYEKSLRPT